MPKRAALDAKITNLVDSIVNADSDTLIAAYETQIEGLEADKRALAEQTKRVFEPRRSIEEAFGTACNFRANPWKIWVSGEFAHKRAVLRLAFPGILAYCPEEGFRAAKTTLPFKVLGDLDAEKSRMVGGTAF